jgi:hypothetical protein
MAKVQGDATTELKAPMVNINGSAMTMISGGLTKIG